MKKLYITLLAFICLSMSVTAQEKSRREIKGDKYVFNYSYDKAIEQYENAKDLTIEGNRNLAVAYQITGEEDQALLVYDKIVNSSTGVLAEDYYNYSMLLKRNAKYSSANTQMDRFTALKPSDLRAKDYVVNKGNLSNLQKDEGEYKVVQMDISSSEQDFAPSFYKDQIVFASTRTNTRMMKKTYNLNGLPFLDMYVADVEGDQLTNPENFDKGLNTKLHDGPASFNEMGTFIAFTSNHVRAKSKDNIVELQIFFSSYADGKWSEATPFNQNDEGYNVGHPSLSADGKTMYFTSDMPGGHGGTDLYKTTQNSTGGWDKAINLGNKINTEGDEMFPFVEETSNTLFFSSDGRYGLGGLDIFAATISQDNYRDVHNVGAPLNTQYDDFAVIVNGTTKKGYFSSDRPGGKGDDDIYSVVFLKGLSGPKTIKGFAMDNNGSPISKTFVMLLDHQGNTIDTVTTGANATYSFVVDSDKNYKLVGSKEQYKDAEKTANTFGTDPIVKADLIMLTKKEVVAVQMNNSTDLGKIAELNPIYFDLDKFNLRADAVTELNKIVKILNDHPNASVLVGAHTDCRESDKYNLALSDKRAKTTAWFIKQRITNPSRISSKGYGESQLTNNCVCEGTEVSGCTEKEHQANRRSEFTLLKSTGANK